MVKGDIVAARMHVAALFIHFRQGVDPVGVVDGRAHQPQARHGATRGLYLREDHEGDDGLFAPGKMYDVALDVVHLAHHLWGDDVDVYKRQSQRQRRRA